MSDDGVRRIPITTPSGDFEVWTRKAGDNPDGTKVLVLHGGPGACHHYLVSIEQPLVEAGYEVWFYDQLGSHESDRPGDPSLWTIERFVDEVDQVRVALDLDAEDLVLYGQSWGGVLGMEYALAHQDHLKGLVISNMMSSGPAYGAYAEQVIKPRMDPDALARIEAMEREGRTDDPAYEELLNEHHYVHHVLRMPVEEWPAPVVEAFAHINHDIYVPMQGPSELGVSGVLATWDRSGDLGRITVPTLVIGAEHDTMDPVHLRWMADQLPSGSYLHCPEGSHLAMWDDKATYDAGLVAWLDSLDA